MNSFISVHIGIPFLAIYSNFKNTSQKKKELLNTLVGITIENYFHFISWQLNKKV